MAQRGAIAWLFPLLLLGGPLHAEMVSVPGIQGLSPFVRHQLHAEELRTTYTLLVKLPDPGEPAAPAGAAVGAPPVADAGARLFVAHGADQAARFAEPAAEWSASWSGAIGDRFENRELAGHTHFSLPPEAFRQGLQWLFASPGGAEPPPAGPPSPTPSSTPLDPDAGG